MENDLISRSALLEQFGEEPFVWDSRDREEVQMHNDWLDYTKLVKEAPAVDAVEVVRCKDCAWCKKPFPEHFPQKLECMRFDMEVAADEFCSRSERRDDE